MWSMKVRLRFIFFFFNDTATTEIYTLSLHDALPIYSRQRRTAPASHLRAMRDDVRGSIRADRQVHVGVQRRCGHCVGSAGIRVSEQALRHQAYAQHKRSSPQHALQEFTPAGDSFTIIRGNVFDLHHAPPLCSSMRIDVRPLRVTLYPTAVPVSCKPAYRAI